VKLCFLRGLSSVSTEKSIHGKEKKTHRLVGRLWKEGCQMVSFQTKNPNSGKFWRALDWKILRYFMTICNILRTFGIFYNHLVGTLCLFATFFPVLVSWTREKSGNPAAGK
jgi:hypothetical protein